MSAPTRSPNTATARPPRWDSRRRTEPASEDTCSNDTASPPVVVPVDKVHLAQELTLLTAPDASRAVGALNGQHVQLMKLHGDGAWRRHEHDDTLFLVLHGRLRVELRERTVEVEPGELLLLPRGVEHRPVADEEVHVLVLEPSCALPPL
ncbi:cupin domain-containing protein [Myxococcus stipitatus]|uniref:cupin domain-containing protein n=1 Tax=Myxococcus stipitatus TaxID=83455 RepID=UPI0030D3B373